MIIGDGGAGANLQKTAFGELAVAENQIHAGWAFPYNINPTQVRSFTFKDGSVTHEDNFAVLDSGVEIAATAEVETVGALTYTPGIGATVRFTAIFDTPRAGTTQIIGIGGSFDGLFFGYDGVQFGVLRRSKGVDTWAYQADWSEDPKPALDHTNGNVFAIVFQWLGFGAQYFYMEDEDGALTEVHRIRYANKHVETSVDVPSLPGYMAVENVSGGTAVSMRSPSLSAMSQGESFPVSFTTPIGYSSTTAVSSGSNYLFTISNPFEYESKLNRLYFEPAIFTISNDTTQAATFLVILDAVLTTPSFTDIDLAVTPAEVDVAAAAYTGGTEIIAVTVAKESGDHFDLGSLLDGFKLWPTSQITFVCEARGNGDVDVGLTFRSRV